ncbi:hypothetical protein JAAN108728_12820 [Janibacter anophelis]
MDDVLEPATPVVEAIFGAIALPVVTETSHPAIATARS